MRFHISGNQQHDIVTKD